MISLEAAEAEKYRRAWVYPEYRRYSPGLIEAQRAHSVMAMQRGDSLADFGAGTGRATAWFQSKGLRVVAIDHVENALETDVPFIRACLWQLPAMKVDHGFCCDVLEHIPTDKVDEVLKGLAVTCVKGIYLRIATRPDVMGPQLIGEPLHMTVLPGAEWVTKCRAVWGSVRIIREDANDVVMVAK